MSIMDYMDNPYAPTEFGPARRAGVPMAKDAPTANAPVPGSGPGSGAAPPPPTPDSTPAGGSPAPTAANAPGGVTAALPYSWYRDHFMANQNLDDAGNSTQPISEAQWNAMSPQDQYGLFGASSYGVDTEDPFYKDVNSRWNAAGNEGNGQLINQFDDTRLKDPSRRWTDPVTGLQLTDKDNVNQYDSGVEWWMPATVLTAGIAGNLIGLDALSAGTGTAATTTAAAPVAEGAALTAPELLTAPAMPAIPAGSEALLTAPELAGTGAAITAPAAAATIPEAAGVSLPGVTEAAVPSIPPPPSVANPALVNPGVTLPDMPTIPGSSGPASFTDKIINGLTNNPLAVAGVAANLLAGNRASQNREGIGDQVRDVVKPISDQAETLLAQYGRGELNPADEFNINRWEFEQIAKAKNYYAKAGMGDSSAALAAEGRIREQAQGMRDTALKGILQMGLQASGMTIGPLIQAIQLQSGEDDQFAQATSSALNSLFLLQAWQSKTPGVDT